MFYLKKISVEIFFYMVDIEVGLFIGLNCLSVLCLREIVYGEDLDLYVVWLFFGWYINGFFCN